MKVWSIKSIGGFSGCLLYKEGRYEEALVKFNGAQQVVGYDPHLSYNVALCHYRWVVLKRNLIGSYSFFFYRIFFLRLKDFAPSLKHIADIIERGIREHPELSVGMQTEGIEVMR